MQERSQARSYNRDGGDELVDRGLRDHAGELAGDEHETAEMQAWRSVDRTAVNGAGRDFDSGSVVSDEAEVERLPLFERSLADDGKSRPAEVVDDDRSVQRHELAAYAHENIDARRLTLVSSAMPLGASQSVSHRAILARGMPGDGPATPSVF